MEYGLLGEKLTHSFSKEIHGKIAPYSYEYVELPQSAVESFIKKKDFLAINVTIPYKQTVIPFLESIDESAKKIGAVNTVVNKDGKLHGYNTDYEGMKNLIERVCPSLDGKKVLIIGVGGTAKTTTAVVKDMGAREIIYTARHKRENTLTLDEIYSLHGDVDFIVNTSPCGMFPNVEDMPIDLSRFTNISGVVDAIYNPLNTSLVLTAKDMGIKAEGGLFMLSSQAVRASELFRNVKIDDEQKEKVFKAVLKDKQNVVLTGMPSCGKSCIGRRLAKILNKKYVDTDEEIIKKTEMPIAEYFEKYGESQFRKVEAEVIAEVSKISNAVVSTGGGAVLNKNNIFALRKNGLIFFIDRSLDLLIATNDRPLSKNRELLEKRYKERIDIYNSTCDFKIENNGKITDTVKAIVNAFENA